MKNFFFVYLVFRIGLTVYTLNLTPAYSWAGSSSTFTFYDQFTYSGEKVNLQVEGTGEDAKLKLVNKWIKLNPPPEIPSERTYSPIAYDAQNKKIILFGGFDVKDDLDLNDTWVYNSYTQVPYWEEKKFLLNSPAARRQHTLVSIGNGQILLFGGVNSQGVYFNDLWIYDVMNNSWNGIFPFGVVPSSRALVSATFVPERNSVYFFGGYFGETRFNETWEYQVNNSSWVKLTPLISPSNRDSAGMCYDFQQQKIILFGGSTGLPAPNNYLNDTWVYDASSNVWENRNPSFPGGILGKRATNIVYDKFNQKIVLFSGLGSSYADTWFYDLKGNKWYEVHPSSSPSNRYGHSLVYVDFLDGVYLFAGVDGGYHNDLWYYLYRGSGTYISPALSVSFSTSLTWDSFEVFPKAQKGELRFQFASSSDNKSWTKFVGPNGEENTYYSYNYVGKIWDGHKDQSYFKFKAYFQSNSLFESPELDAITIFYNCSPTMPTPVYPYPGANINRSSFTWKNADDEDNLDVLTYEIRLGSAPVPASGDIYITGIPQSLTQYSSTEPVTVISEGKWYWQIRAYDGTTYGDWSESYVFFLDTTPPTTVNDLTASIGPANGTVELTWTNTGDDGIIGDISNGGYLVKWSSSGRIAEGDWEIIVDSVTWTEILITLGSKRTKIISNLQNATTYYFSLRIIDDAGNLSPLSNSTSAFTNVPPEVTLLSPNQGEYGNTNLSTSSLNISWTYSDSNPGDTHNFAIYLSTDNETSYTILVVSGLTDKTTFYLWDSRQAPNGSSNRIKVIATDKRGLEGWDISDSAFTISNLNERPEIHIIYPINNEIISGTTYFHWSYSDPNRSDKHQFQIYLSSNVGLTWKEIGRVLNQEYYLFDSTSEPNRINYLLKVKIEDIISPPMNPLSNEDTSNFGISNYNLAPGTFSLISPPSGRLYPSLPLFFEWEEAIDPNGDEVTYTLYYSTDKNFGASVAVNTSKNNFCRLLFFDEEKIYYWYVEAKDQFGASRLSNEIGNFFTISRKRVKIDNLEVEVSTGLPDNTYLRVDKISSGEYLPLSWANQHSINDPTTRKIDDFAYRVGIYDTSDKLISPSGIKLKILYGCQDINGYFKGTNIPVDNLRICRLEEKVSSAFWTPAVYPQEVDQGKKNVSVSIEYSDSFPGIIISLLGYAPVVAYLSQVANYPNPFNPTKGEKKTRIEYYLTEDSNVTIRIYNLVGDLVWTKENAAGVGTPEGYRNIEFWDGKNDAGMIVANGVYLCLITARPADSAGGEERKISRLIGVVK